MTTPNPDRRIGEEIRPRPVVGQTLYALNINNNARHQPQALRPVVVISVGRKYFKALPEEYANRTDMAVEYCLEDWRQRSEHTPDWRLYLTETSWENEKEANRLTEDLRNLFTGYGRPELPLSALRTAHAALIGATSPNRPTGATP